ncbi:MAG: 23S rRNA (pseudouridine(1915)-N(3))-methyltransferase RlmH [Hyphomicrobiales bacterium]|nr:23S rRNA (pseudouridine(1915)-N(3))-methyltransferase RlmH [Hyphomicrobiales bacterium]
MRVIVAAIGRARKGAERELVDRYVDRARRSGRALGFSGPDIVELDEGREATQTLRRKSEGQKLIAAVPAGVGKVVLDEAGRALSTRELSALLASWRDDGVSGAAFLIGGPDGHGAGVKRAADLVLSLGAMTWPHLLVRAMIVEQIYRAMTILAGHPYHRG